MSRDYFKSRPYLKFALAAGFVWTIGAAVSLVWNLQSQESAILEAARTAARVANEKDIVYRSWSARHGGVYVPVSEFAQPNPFLKDLPERDLVTTGGKKLTLINPSYMNRQVHELEHSMTGVHGHLTSLTPTRPGNAPDEWEKKALKAVMAGEKEFSGIQVIEGKEFMRLLSPVVTEEACLKCHKHQGYEVGRIQGGLSASFPMELFRMSSIEAKQPLWSWHLFPWLLGVAGIAISTVSLNAHYRRNKRSEDLIMDSLRDKEVLLREIHHRVKNNLQVISGMLDLQSSLLTDPAARASLKGGRNRVMSMALIHQKLYQSEDIAQVNMESYVESLVADLFTAFGVDKDEIKLKIDVQAVRLNLDMAIPLGLLLSELVTNAVKYAFNGDNQGRLPEVSITFRKRPDGNYLLTVSDNGIGLPENFDLETASSLGLKLVHTLVEQLDGDIILDQSSGTSWSIVCPPYKGAEGVI